MKKVLLLNKNRKNLEILSDFLKKHNFESYLAHDYETLKGFIEKGDFELALIDISGFDTRIWDYTKALQDKGIPFVLISTATKGKDDTQLVGKGAGAILAKPLSPKRLIEVIDALIG